MQHSAQKGYLGVSGSEDTNIIKEAVINFFQMSKNLGHFKTATSPKSW